MTVWREIFLIYLIRNVTVLCVLSSFCATGHYFRTESRLFFV